MDTILKDVWNVVGPDLGKARECERWGVLLLGKVERSVVLSLRLNRFLYLKETFLRPFIRRYSSVCPGQSRDKSREHEGTRRECAPD